MISTRGTDFETVPVGTVNEYCKLLNMVDELIMASTAGTQYRLNSAQRARVLMKEIRNGNVYSDIIGSQPPKRHAR